MSPQAKKYSKLFNIFNIIYNIDILTQHYIKYMFYGTFTDGDTWFAKKSETLTKSPHKLHNDLVQSSASELKAL